MTAATEPEEIPGLFDVSDRKRARDELDEYVARLVERQRQRTGPEQVKAEIQGKIFDFRGLVLLAFLDRAVPLWIEETKTWTFEQRQAKAAEAADLIASGTDGIVAGGAGKCRHKRRPGTKHADDPCAGDALNAIAMGLALGAQQPGGATFECLHWCTQPHPRLVEVDGEIRTVECSGGDRIILGGDAAAMLRLIEERAEAGLADLEVRS